MSTDVADPMVLSDDHGDGSADFTITFAEDDHKFSASAEGNVAVVEYEETLSWRGVVRVSEPGDDIFKALMTSDEMTAFLDEHGCETVRRARR